MAIEVRIPTILRTYTDGQKAVEGKGDTLADLLADLDGRHPGLRGRLVTEVDPDLVHDCLEIAQERHKAFLRLNG